MKTRAVLFFILLLSMGCKKDSVVETTALAANRKFVGTYAGTWKSQPYGSSAVYTTDSTFSIGLYTDGISNTTNFGPCPVVQFDENDFTYFYHGSLIYRNDSIFYLYTNGPPVGATTQSFKGKKL